MAQGRPTKAKAAQKAAEKAAEEASLGIQLPDVDTEDESLTPGWDERFDEWRAGLGAEADQISIYAYSLERVGGQERRRQEFIWRIAADGDFPDLHYIGIILGTGDFDLIARAKGRNILQRRVYFGKAYDDLREENLAQQKAARTAAPTMGSAPASMPSLSDPFAPLERLFTLAQPLVREWIKNSNPMNQVRAMSEMGNEMAKTNFNNMMSFSKKAAERALNAMDDDDDDEEVTPAAPASAAAPGADPTKAPGWEQKLSQIADLIIAKGEDFVRSKGAEKEFMKRAILNDQAFQTLLKNPESTKAALTRLYKKCGVDMVNDVLNELGIMGPKPLNGHARPTAKAKA